MKLPATAASALSLSLALTVSAQTTFTDPANLRGERVSPKTGRELPIDGGLAANDQPNTALGLQQLLRKLNTRASLMLIVAHPDDEDGGMLTFYSRGLGARVADLSLTRGEGGQNAMTGDFEDALGLIRTQELLAADRYSSTDQFFGTEVDFGFSKTKEEAFRKWTHQRVLYDAVRAVRLYRPLVIAAVFIGGVTDGHGQHQVSGEIAQEVFKAAADPTVFPELTREGILPWAPLKVYARVPTFAIQPQGLFDYATNQYVPPAFTNYVTGQTTSTPPTPDVIIHEGQTDPLLTNAAANPADLRNPNADPGTQLSYVQFARIGLGLQRTQIGPGVRLATPGAYDVAYHLYGSRLCGAADSVSSTGPRASRGGNRETCIQPAPATKPAPTQDAESANFFDGIDTSLGGISTLTGAPFPPLQQLLGKLSQSIQVATDRFDPKQPSRIASQLAEALQSLDGAISVVEAFRLDFPDAKENVLHELRIKRVQLADALALALAVHIDATTEAATLIPNTPVSLHLTADEIPFAGPVFPFITSSEGPVLWTDVDYSSYDQHHPPAFDQSAEVNRSMLATSTRPYFFRTNIEQPVYQLRNPVLRNAAATPPPLVAWIQYRYQGITFEVGRVVHSGSQPVGVVPAASLSFASRAQVLADDSPGALVTTSLFPPQTPPITPRLMQPAGWASSATSHAAGQTSFQITPPVVHRSPATFEAVVKLPNSQLITEGFRPVGYPGLTYTNIYTPATTRIVPVDLKLPTHRRIGYLPGTGDAVADNLRSVGFEVTNLTVSDLTPASLAHFDTVILGVRTYNAHTDLHGAATQALLDYARDGGNVIVQYQTAEFTAADAPYPLTLGNAEKVVDETTPVRLLDPGVPALTYPNRITPADFNSWIEERGHGFLHAWDPHYTALTETHDPGAPAEHVAPQLPQEGGLITAQLGKGHWTYVAFALYRQLPEAVPGAFRLFTNLIALADSSSQRKL